MGLATNLPRLLLAGVFVSDFSPDQAAAYVRLYNAGTDPADLSGLLLEWDGVTLAMPSRKLLPAGGSAHVAWNADAYLRLLTRGPDYSVTAAAGVPTLIAPSGAARPLRPEGGALRLLSKAGDVLDAFVWGNGRAVPGWSGPAVGAGSAGTVFQRAVMEDSLGAESAGRFMTDAGTAAAWRQGTDWLPRRMARAGQSELTYPTFTVPGATAFTCPDAAFDVISQFIDKAS
ncbi:MAG: hypothetical protein JWN15_914, partial [Firmicutes bacterium]|nr:hypothetical protein [Bacillota bacterium]